MKGRIAGVDFGKVRIGVAITDEMQIIASPLGTLLAKKKPEETADALIEMIQEKGKCVKIILGLPLHLSGKESEMSHLVRNFATILESRSGIPVELYDERLTSSQIDSMLKNEGIKRKKRAQLSDPLSATLLLQTYLDQMIFPSS